MKPMQISGKQLALRRTWLGTAAILLCIVAGAKLYSAFGDARILDSMDPLLRFQNRWVMVAVGVLEMTIAGLLLTRVAVSLKLVSVFWLSANFLSYHAAAHYLNVNICPCAGNVTDKLGIPPEMGHWVMIGLAAYLLIGSIAFLFFRESFTCKHRVAAL
jgi:hypothetical protein